MTILKSARIEAELVKAREKLAEQQGKIKELEQKRTEFENMEIVETVRGLNVPLNELASLLARAKSGETAGQKARAVNPEQNREEDEG